MDKLHVIHSRNGKIGTDTTAADIKALVAAFGNSERGHMAIHFHGGVVSKADGLAIAHRLTPRYEVSAYPVFFVWESGIWETLRNNIQELADEPVFKQLVRKLLEHVLKRVGGKSLTRAVLPGLVDKNEVRKAVNTFWAAPSKETVPYRDWTPFGNADASRSAVDDIEFGGLDAELQADLEQDYEFQDALATLQDLSPESRSLLNAADSTPTRTSRFSAALTDELSAPVGVQGRGIITWIRVVALLKRVLVGVLTRYAHGRDHGLYATVVEEILRAIKIGGETLNTWAQVALWNSMKKDTADAFGDDDACAGTSLLQALSTKTDKINRITLIGHSTGAIYIAHWLEAASKLLPNVKFDVVFLAPAITYELFAQTLTRHQDRIASFRMFAMRDELERKDQVWGTDPDIPSGQDLRRFIYPSSLLYVVSGLLETDKTQEGYVDSPDKPLLGMERFFTGTGTFNANAFPEVAMTRQWLAADPDRTVWSIVAGSAPGLNSASTDHGYFDDDEATLQSVLAILAR